MSQTKLSPETHMPSPLELMMNTMNQDNKKTGMTCQIKRKLPDGSLVDADARALESLGTKSRMAYAAQNLKDMTPEDRTAWALEMKDYANALYAERHILEAMEKYVEALSASNFGNVKMNPSSEGVKSSQNKLESVPEEDNVVPEEDNVDIQLEISSSDENNKGNIENLILPILCNLAACCLQLKQYRKALKFADTALELRPRCGKAIMRRGMSLVHLGENEKAVASLEVALSLSKDKVDDDVIELGDASRGKAIDISDSRMNVVMPISDSDLQRIPILLQKARKAKTLYDKNKANQKKQMQKLFGATTSATATKVLANEKENNSANTNIQDLDANEAGTTIISPKTNKSSIERILIASLILAVVYVFIVNVLQFV